MPTLKSHTHLQFAPASATPKIAKEYVLPSLNLELTETSESQAERGKPVYNIV